MSMLPRLVSLAYHGLFCSPPNLLSTQVAEALKVNANTNSLAPGETGPESGHGVTVILFVVFKIIGFCYTTSMIVQVSILFLV